MRAETARRYILTACAFVFVTCLLGGWLQANVQEWAKASGQDQYIVRFAGPAMTRLAEITETPAFIAIAWSFIGGSLILWIDYALRRRAKTMGIALLVIAVVVAFAGAWVLLSPPAKQVSEQPPRPAPLSQQNSATQFDQPPPRKFYSLADKERIAEALYKLTELVDGTAMQIKNKSTRMNELWQHEIHAFQRNEAPKMEPIFELEREVEQLMVAFHTGVYDNETGLLRAYNRYRDDLTPLLHQDANQPASSPLLDAARKFNTGCVTLKMAIDKGDREVAYMIIQMNQLAFDRFNQAINDYYGWITHVQLFIQEKTVELSK